MMIKRFILTGLAGALISIFLISCTPPADSENEGEQIELSSDGSWGYAGRFAHIANNTMFFSYLDTKGSTWVASYHFGSGELVKNNIWGQELIDLHSANPLIIRPDGRIQVFLDRPEYSNKDIIWKVSKEPFSIQEFGELQHSGIEGDIMQGRQHYPMVHRESGEVYLVLNAIRDTVSEGTRDVGKALRETVMWKSSDGGDTWSEYANLWGLGKGLEGNRCYTRTYMKGDDIHFVTLRVGWNEPLAGHLIGRIEGVYYVKYNVKKKAFFRADGSHAFDITDVPVYSVENFDEIWHWQKDGDGRQRAFWSDLVVSDDGKPYVAFTIQDAAPQGATSLPDGYWATPNNEGEWTFSKVATLARGWDNKPERVGYPIAIDPLNPNRVFIAKSVSKEKDLSQIQCLETSDNGKTWELVKSFSDEGRLTTVVAPNVLDESERAVDVLWLDGKMEEWGVYDTKVMTRRFK